MGCSKCQGTRNPRLTNPSSVKYYSQENQQNLDLDLQQTKQPFELRNPMSNFNQFSENSCQNLNNFQTSNITLNPFRVQQTACSKTITESVPIANSISTFPPQALPSVEENPESQLPPSHQFSGVFHPILNERFRHPSFETNSSPWTSNTAPYWQIPTINHSIKLPPLTIQNFKGNPLKYHEWINKFLPRT